MSSEDTIDAKKEDKFCYDFKNDKWYKFNDTIVEEINLNEATLIGKLSKTYSKKT